MMTDLIDHLIELKQAELRDFAALLVRTPAEIRALRLAPDVWVKSVAELANIVDHAAGLEARFRRLAGCDPAPRTHTDDRPVSTPDL